MSVSKRLKRFAERGAPGYGPAKYAFLPWLIMGVGALSHVLQGKAGNPWLSSAALLVFNSLYISVVFSAFGTRLPRRQIPPLIALAGMTAVTFAVTLAYGSSWTLFFPLLSLASGTVRQLRGKPFLAWLVTLSVAAGAIASWQNGAWSGYSIGYGTLISGMVTAAVLSLFDTVAQLDKAREELARAAVEKERTRFSRDLHDLLGHTLSVVVVKAEAVRRLAPGNLDGALAQAADIEAVGRQALTEIREAVTGYREDSLATELDRARSVLEAAGIEPVVRQSGPPLPPQAEALLGWVVRECSTNTVRHSGAARCEIEVRAADDRVRLTITDDGRGPGPARGTGPGPGGGTGRGAGPGTGPDPAGGHGSGPDGEQRLGEQRLGERPLGGTGLKGLGERLAASGGTLDHGPDGRRGFRVVVELPVDTEETAETAETAETSEAKGAAL
ncbi:sensor histidine kinase [Streptomyces sp. NPDC048172]|uniref:sensor histidine kinase n=1 Tax=Streptomyces sp. NPDC048172 TaxID=3365505 RepID=UPI00371FF0A9